MAVRCAKCHCFACRAGRPDAAPDDCPMLGQFPPFEKLYSNKESRKLAFHSARVEALGYCRWTRLREIAEFAERVGYKRMGLGYCPDMTREAVLAAEYFRDTMLDVRLPPQRFECDPSGQAGLLADEGTQLNVIAGMCVSHEAIFVRASRAPVTCLVARDERFRHNPVAALYTFESYSRSDLLARDPTREHAPYRGADIDVLNEVADELLPERHDKWCRVRETMEYAHRLGVTHVGVSFCVGLRHEALQLTRVLEANGFRVTSVCCKTGSVPKEKIGIEDHQKVNPGQPEMICNPLAQAKILNDQEVQLALVLGQCVGHDSATLSMLKMPAAFLVAKDRVLGHNSVAALYELEDR